MTDFAHPQVSANVPNVPGIGALAFHRFIFDFAASYKPADLNLNDRIQIGVVPAGHSLVPHLSRLSLPILEGGTPASDYTLGTDAVPAALKGSAPSETAVVLFGEDWLVPAAVIGHPTEDTPIYLTFITANLHTLVVTGQIVFEPVTRAYRAELDG